MSGTAYKSRELRAFAPALILLAICALINYVDRGNLSIAAPLLKDELHISVTQLGILLSAFFWTYTAMQFVSGWLVDRFEVNWVMAAGFLVWSLATSATGLVRGFTMLLANAADARRRRVCNGSRLLENLQLPFAGAQPGPRQWRTSRGSEVRAGSRHFGSWPPNGEIWLATRIHRHRPHKPGVASCLDQMEAT